MKIKVKSQYTIDFTGDNSIGKVFGFSKRIIPANKAAFSDLPVNIMSINSIKVHCNLVQSNIEDNVQNTNILYDFPLDYGTIGAKIIKQPNPITYFAVKAEIIYKDN